jgi:hypothetical protein
MMKVSKKGLQTGSPQPPRQSGTSVDIFCHVCAAALHEPPPQVERLGFPDILHAFSNKIDCCADGLNLEYAFHLSSVRKHPLWETVLPIARLVIADRQS